MSDQNKSPDEQLRDYLTQDLALAKLHLNESRRNSGKLVYLAIILSFLILACVGGFSATVFFITKEHTKQLEAIFNANWETDISGEREKIYQDSGSGAPAIINNRVSGSTITTHNNINK